MSINATILGQTIAFILFVLFCMKYVWPPLITAIDNRQKEISNGLVFAERAKKELEIAKLKANDYLKEAKIEALSIIEQANKHKLQLIHEAKTEAEDNRKKIMAQIKVEIETERKRAGEELRKQISMLALAVAEKIIDRSVDKAIRNDIVDKIIAEL